MHTVAPPPPISHCDPAASVGNKTTFIDPGPPPSLQVHLKGHHTLGNMLCAIQMNMGKSSLITDGLLKFYYGISFESCNMLLIWLWTKITTSSNNSCHHHLHTITTSPPPLVLSPVGSELLLHISMPSV